MHCVKRWFIVCLHILVMLFIVTTIAGCTKNEDKVERAVEQVSNEVLPTSALLATIADNEIPPLAKDSAKHDATPGVQSPATDIVIEMNNKGRGVAYLAQVDRKVHVVHNGKAGKFYENIENLVLSPDGQRVAYAAFSVNKWRMVVDAVESSPYDELGPPAFSPDNKHVAYEAKMGDKWYIVSGEKKSSGSVSYYAKPEFSADSQKIVFVENPEGNRKMRVVVCNRDFTHVVYKESAGVNIVVSNDKNRVATVMETNGKSKIIEFSFAQPEKVKESPLYDSLLPLVYDKQTDVLTYCAVRGGIRYAVFDGKEERLPEGEIATAPVVRPDKKGVALFLSNQVEGRLHQAFYSDGKKSGAYKEAADLVYSADSRLRAFCIKTAEGWKVLCNDVEGPVFERTVTPQFSPDGKYLVYRARTGKKRFVVVVDTMSGNILKKHPVYDRIFETVFTADGKSVAYGVVAGKQIAWKVEKL